MTQSKRRTRSDKGHPQLTRRDEAILLLIGEQTGYRFDQLQGLLARHPDTRSEDPSCLSESRTHTLIQRWEELGLAAYDKIYHHDPGWVWLTRRGLSHVHLRLRFLDLYRADLNHLFWINETRTLIEETYGARPGFCWESERVMRTTREHLKAQQRRDPDLWLPLEYQGTHRPDALLRYRINQEHDAPEVISAIEVEASEKKYAIWKKIFIELTRYYSNAHYYVHSTVKAALQDALAKFQAEIPQYGEPALERRQYIYIHDLAQHL